MIDDMPLHKRLDTYVEVFAADDEGLTLTPDVWNRLRSDIKEAAMLLARREGAPSADAVRWARVVLLNRDAATALEIVAAQELARLSNMDIGGK